jgi:hypothetical protein
MDARLTSFAVVKRLAGMTTLRGMETSLRRLTQPQRIANNRH